VKTSIIEARMAAETVEKVARVDGGPPPSEVTVTVKEPSLANRIVTTTRAAARHAVEVIFLLFFLLAYGETFYRKLLTIPDHLRAKVRVVRITTEIQREVSSFLLTITCINAGLGAATAVAMAALSMPNPVLWGGLTAVMNFVPYVGSSITLLVLTFVAILTFDTLARALLVPAVFLALATIEGQVISPIIVGRRMALSPLVIGIALMAGAWIWGAVGMLIAVPVLAIARIVCAHDEQLAPLATLLDRD
jgi:predicted PurR-regulated permease PerM